MDKKTSTEQELFEEPDAESVRADKVAEPPMDELTPLERLKGSVISYEGPLDSVWDDYFDSDDGGVTDDFMEERDQPQTGRE
ncbi:hypothetical protein [Marinobacter changyiensis]|uniref:hypothetical protein n=1 Tax=Marinobacter changyiensis TaxID=2604091 RepID=UPI001263F9AD|nr:hypothetical protein [Marinobacter changyiensis]